jgi:germination protein M
MRGKAYRSKGWVKAGVFLLLIALLSACGLMSPSNQEGSAQIDPPPADLEKAMIEDTLAKTYPEGNDVVTVYLLDRNGYLAPMTLRVEGEPSTVQATAIKSIQWLTADKQQEEQLPSGFKAILPEGMRLSSVTENKDEHTLAVDFAAPLPSIPASQERKVLEALVWTLTELPGIDKVKLSVAGQPISSLPASGLPVDQVLTRGLGINLETAQGVQVNRAMAVTLYFSAQSAAGEGYFVPVTRLINRQGNVAQAALEQLIRGPQSSSQLSPVVTSEITVEQLSQMADTISVSLRDTKWEPESVISAVMLDALVLTLTEESEAPQVRVVMNGDDSLVDSDNRSYERPVTRPTSINALQR